MPAHPTFDACDTHATILPDAVGMPPSASLPLASDGLSIQDVIGEGGVGRIHLAHQALLDREVAVKRLKQGSPAQARAQLLHEARMMGCLEHPNIPPVHALGADEAGQPILVMKRIQGQTWDPSAYSLEANVRVLRAVTAALAHAHTRGIVHRDLKPENVMLGAHGEVYLMDWGLATTVDTPTGVSGTPIHMAPEMFTASRADPRMDSFLVGAVLYLLLTGRPRNDAPSFAACRAAAEGPTLLPAEADPELATLTRQATAPRERRPTVHVLEEALEAWLEHRGAVRLVALADDRIARLGDGPLTDGPLLTECLFALRQAVQQRPDHPPYQARLDRLLHRAIDDATTRDVRLDLATGWADELGLPADAPERVALDRARERAHKSALLAYEADYQVGYTERYRVYLQWFALFGGSSAVAWSLGLGHHRTHGGTVVLAVLFLATLLITIARGWEQVTANLASRAVLGGFLSMAGTLLVNRIAGYLLDVPLQAVFATDALLLGAICLTLGFTYGRVTRLLGVGLLAGSVAVVVAPASWAGWLFLGPALTTMGFFGIAVRGGFARTEALNRPGSPS